MVSFGISRAIALCSLLFGPSVVSAVDECPQLLRREDLSLLYEDVDTGVSTLRTFEQVDDALNYAQLLYYLGEDVGGMPLFVNETMTQIEDITFFPLNTTTLAKRWTCSNAPLGTHFTQRQVAQDGHWWGPWKKSSQCAYGGSLTLRWETQTTKSVGGGFDLGFASGVASAHFGFQISKLVTKGGEFTCNKEGARVVSIWTQSQYYWSDQQTQRCVRKHYGSSGCHCGAWGPYIHGDVPVKSEPNLGCSADDAAGC